jgi:Flp pilus assembly protein CpaB
MSTPGGEPRREGGFSLGLAAGAALGFVISAALVGTLGYLYEKRRDHQRGYAYEIPVIVALRDLPAGTVITYADLGQRGMPERFVTASLVKVDNAHHIIGSPS